MRTINLSFLSHETVKTSALIAVGTGFFLNFVWIDPFQIISTRTEEILNTGVTKAERHRFGLRIDQPHADGQRKGCNYRHPAGEQNDGLWPDSSVRRILKNEMYIGSTCNLVPRLISLTE